MTNKTERMTKVMMGLREAGGEVVLKVGVEVLIAEEEVVLKAEEGEVLIVAEEVGLKAGGEVLKAVEEDLKIEIEAVTGKAALRAEEEVVLEAEDLIQGEEVWMLEDVGGWKAEGEDLKVVEGDLEVGAEEWIVRLEEALKAEV